MNNPTLDNNVLSILLNLPYVNATQRRLLPKNPGIYLLIKDEKVFYVGSTKNIYNRSYDNSMCCEAEKIGYITQEFDDKKQRILAEDFLIASLRPSANGRLNGCISIDKARETMTDYLAICKENFYALLLPMRGLCLHKWKEPSYVNTYSTIHMTK